MTNNYISYSQYWLCINSDFHLKFQKFQCIAVTTLNFKSSLTWRIVVSWLWGWIAWPGSALSLTGRSWADWSWRLWGWEHPAGWNMERKDWRETLHCHSRGLQSLHSDQSGKCCAAVFPQISPSSYQSHCHYLTLHESSPFLPFYSLSQPPPRSRPGKLPFPL